MSNKYAQSKIYKITGGGLTYIGSTTKKYLCQRMSNHRANKKLFEAGKSNYCSSHEILNFPDCQITLIETVICNSKDELHARERYWIETHDCVNKRMPGRTQQELNQARKTRARKWHAANKDHRMEYQRNYRANKKQQTSTNTPAESLSALP